MWHVRGESNAGGICRYQSAYRGGGQPEGSDDDPRGEADSPWSHQKIRLSNEAIFLFGLFTLLLVLISLYTPEKTKTPR